MREPERSLATYGQPGIGEETVIAEQPGAELGRYRLLDVLGSGRFGTVWRAEQREPVRRTVAIKILKLGMDTREVVARFERERQALACMNHPGIAKVLDGGATAEGRPFFVMELIEGEPITAYCDRAGMAIDERLRVFLAVCRALQHAHGKGVVHRDLKPENVLVTERDGAPHPVVIDFGIAKAIEGELAGPTAFTGHGQIVGTPAYMSPEQTQVRAMDVDARTDVWSLGVVLYELLAGCRPFDGTGADDGGHLALLRSIREDDAPAPSSRFARLPPEECVAVARRRRLLPRTLQHRVRGDLEAILGKALERDRERRYESCSALAADLERHLRSESVLATSPTWTYRVRKYVRRHRLGVGVLLSLIAGSAASAVGWFEASEQAVLARFAEGEQQKLRLLAEDQERQASSEAQKSRRVLDLVHRMLGSADPHEGKPRDYTVRQLLDDFDLGLSDDLSGQPTVELALRRLMGRAYLALDLPDRAVTHFEREHELAVGAFGPKSREAAIAMLDLGNVRHDKRDYSGAIDLAETALRAVASGEASGSWIHVWAHREIADNLMHLGRHQESRVHVARGLALHRMGRHRSTNEETRLVQVLGQISMDEGRYAEAVGFFREALEHTNGSPNEAGAVISLLATASECCGKLSEAERLRREALSNGLSLYGDDHPQVASDRANLASTLAARGSFADAEATFREALATIDRSSVPDPSTRASILALLGNVYLKQAKYAKAKRVLHESLELFAKLGDEDCDNGTQARNWLATVLTQTGRHAEAKAEYERLLAPSTGIKAHRIARIRNNYAILLGRMGRLREAEEVHRQSLAAMQSHFDPKDREISACRHALALSLTRQGKLEEAEGMARENLAILREVFGPGNPDVSHGCVLLAAIHHRAGRLSEAETLVREGLAIRRTVFGPTSQWVGESLQQLGQVLRALASVPGERREARLAEACQVFREMVEIAEQIHGERDLLVASLRLEQLGVELQAKDLVAAVSTTSRLEAITREHHQDRHAFFAKVLSAACSVRQHENRWTEAEALARECLELQEKVDRKDRLHADMTGALGIAIAMQRRFDEAEPLLLDSLERAGAFGDPWRREALLRLALYHEARGDAEAAAGIRQQLEASTLPSRDSPKR